MYCGLGGSPVHHFIDMHCSRTFPTFHGVGLVQSLSLLLMGNWWRKCCGGCCWRRRWWALPQLIIADRFHDPIIPVVLYTIGLWILSTIDFSGISGVIHFTVILADFYFCRIADDIQTAGIIFHIDFIVIADDPQMDFIVFDGELLAIRNIFTFLHWLTFTFAIHITSRQEWHHHIHALFDSDCDAGYVAANKISMTSLFNVLYAWRQANECDLPQTTCHIERHSRLANESTQCDERACFYFALALNSILLTIR